MATNIKGSKVVHKPSIIKTANIFRNHVFGTLRREAIHLQSSVH